MIYLNEGQIEDAKRTATPSYGRTVDGYTKRSGAPTGFMVRLKGERRWRRLMVWQFSNASTLFVRVGGDKCIVNEWDIPTL